MNRMLSASVLIVPLAILACGASSNDDSAGTGDLDQTAALHPSVVGTWGRSGRAEGPDGPVSIAFDKHNAFDSVYRVDQIDGGRKGAWRRIFGDVTAIITYVGPDSPPAFLKSRDGDFLLVEWSTDESDLFTVRFDASNKRVVLNFVGARRGQGLKVRGTKGPDVVLEKDFNRP